jgi:N-acetylmuramoyl-L-alanine amidase
MVRAFLLAGFVALVMPALAAALVAGATATPDRGGAPLTVTFDASGSSPADSYEWDFDDGTTGSGVSVTHQYASPGAYDAQLTVTAGADTASTTVSVLAQAVTLTLSSGTVVYGGSVTATGSVNPVEAGLEVTLEQRSGGAWNPVASAFTDAAGAFSTSFTPTGGGPLRARLDDGDAMSVERALSVLPAVTLAFGHAKAFLGAPMHADVVPATYAAHVRVSVLAAGRLLARRSVAVVGGVIATRVPTPWAGAVTVRLDFPASGGLSARTISRRIAVSARTLRRGARGPDVSALHRRLAQLRVHVAGIGTVFGAETYDSVIAFQKARGLPRTGVVDARMWRALGAVRFFRPHYAAPTPHIEIDKSRQTLMIVRRGVVTGIIPVSTGATGNTPVGAFHILWKAPATSTWLGSAILYRTMTFHGNFAIHGYYSVPPWPASHGCVRVPMWEANWLYVQSPVGERVYVTP